jgi:glucose-1-phosphate cytidylyltransferase
MKVVILAGGRGSRLNEYTKNIPKPMVQIGGKPILWHIMKIYSFYGINNFIICCGYKKKIIEKYFTKPSFLKKNKNWNINFVDTGIKTFTGGRLKRIKKLICNENFFYFTYGDGLSNVNIKKLTDFHIKNKKYATVTAALPPGRYGTLNINKKSSIVEKFYEKKKGGDGFINGGFFILSPKVLKYIKNDYTIWEKEPMYELSKDKQLIAFTHNGFWQSMDTYRDKLELEKIWKKKGGGGNAGWKIWK